MDSAGLVGVEQHELHSKAIEQIGKTVEDLESQTSKDIAGLTAAVNEARNEISRLREELNTKAGQSGLNDTNTKNERYCEKPDFTKIRYQYTGGRNTGVSIRI